MDTLSLMGNHQLSDPKARIIGFCGIPGSAMPFIGLEVIFMQLKLTFRIVRYTFDVLGTSLVRGSFVVLVMVSLNRHLGPIIQAERLSEGLPRPRSGREFACGHLI